MHETDKTRNTEMTTEVYYRANESPKFVVALLFGFQQTMVCASGLMVVPFVISQIACAGAATALIRAQLCATTLVVTGLATILQNSFGVRLALFQGPCFAFVPALFAFSGLPEFQCHANATAHVPEEYYLGRLQMMQGSLIAASGVQMIIGVTGLIGLLTKYIGPLTIAPLMLHLEMSVIEISLSHAQKHWVSVVLIFMLIFLAFYLVDVKVPVPTIKNGRITMTKAPVFTLFPYLITVAFCWLLCLVMTLTDWEPVGGHARTDANDTMAVLHEAPWIRIPYPGQWGAISLNSGLFLGFVAATLASVIESVGDYHACARVSGERPPPSHAVNRGVLIEGVGCLIAGFMGIGVGVTTYSENIGVIGITKVASRMVMQLTGVILVFLGIFTKFGAVLATLPEPLVGGVLAVSLGVVGGVGLSSVQMVNLRLTRNSAILGLAVIFGSFIPLYFDKHPINTGIRNLDQVFNVLLTIRMLIGGLIGFFLDNTMPGATRTDRGLRERGIVNTMESDEDTTDDAYSFSPAVMKVIQRIPGLRYLPFLPKPHS